MIGSVLLYDSDFDDVIGVVLVYAEVYRLLMVLPGWLSLSGDGYRTPAGWKVYFRQSKEWTGLVFETMGEKMNVEAVWDDAERV